MHSFMITIMVIEFEVEHQSINLNTNLKNRSLESQHYHKILKASPE